VKVAGYDMIITKGGHIAINFQIGDEQKLMLIDTGGVISMLDSDVVTAMNLKKREGGIILFDAYGNKMDVVAIAPTITMGPLKIEDVEFIVTPRKYDPEAVGTLGPNILRPFDIELDFDKKQVNFFTQDHCPGRVVYWTNGGSGHVPFGYDGNRHIDFTAVLDGKDIDTILDTGSPYSVISGQRHDKCLICRREGPVSKKRPEHPTSASIGRLTSIASIRYRSLPWRSRIRRYRSFQTRWPAQPRTPMITPATSLSCT